MKVYKLEGNARCAVCGERADLYIDVLDTTVCRKCGVEMYRQLGVHFVPRSVPNVILRSDKLNAPLGVALDDTVKGKTVDEKENIPSKENKISTHKTTILQRKIAKKIRRKNETI